MNEISTNVQSVPQQFNFIPTTLKEAQEYASIFANSGLCPSSYRGKPNDILIAWQLGSELGLDKMQALRTLGCINGMPFAYGDGQLALIKRHPEFVNMKEWFEGDLKTGSLTAYCTMIRKGQEPVTQSFSINDAKNARLWGKEGPWTLYPRRMLQHRARGFASKDAFPDALYGLQSEQEVKDIIESKQVVEIKTVEKKGLSGLEKALNVNTDESTNINIDETTVEIIEVIANESQVEELKHLLEISNYPKKKWEKWLQKANISKWEEMTSDSIQKCIEFLKNEIQGKAA
ncbi:MAG TPA: hypothetical protein VKR58_10875 [Aquella sp.]|nr:hypothetical protein [Aquella sp.]